MSRVWDLAKKIPKEDISGYIEPIPETENERILKEKYKEYEKIDYSVSHDRVRKIGRPRGKSTRTIQRENWIRDKFYFLKKKRLGSTLNEIAGLILSEMREDTPPCFHNSIYKKSTIIKILKTKPWLDD